MNKIRLTSFLFLIVISVNGQTFQNLQFWQLCDTSKTGLCYWDLSWGSKGSVQPQILGKQNCVLIEGKSEASVGFIEQSSINKLTSTSIIKISASIKSDTVDGKSHGIKNCF